MTPEELARLETLIDPDAAKPAKYGWDDLFQRKLLALLASDRYFLVQALDKIKPNYFSNQVHILICDILFKYFQKEKSIPELFILHQEIADRLKDKEPGIRLFYQAELESLMDYYVPGLETREYLLDKITYFAKVQAIKTAAHKAVEKMKEAPEDEATYTYIADQFREAFLIDRNYEPGLDYFNDTEEMFRLMQETFDGKDRFTSGFESIDANLTGGGLFAGQLGSWIGLPGSGKSLALTKAAVANVLLGHRVLYITLELDQIGVAQRFTSQMTRFNINHLLELKEDVMSYINEFKKDKEDTRMLIIKHFPGGQLDVNGIRAFHSQLLLRGFKPNLVIVDYVGEMKHNPNVKKYESAYEILRDLRGFGVEQQHCTLTCVQPNASAAKLEIGQYIDESNIGTAFDQFRPLDCFWSINQQTIERDAEVGRGFAIKHRNGKGRFHFYMGFDYSGGSLNVFEITNERYRASMSLVQEKRAANVKMDKFPEEKKQRSKHGFQDTDNVINPGENEV